MAPIPLVDLQAAHAEVADDVNAGFKRIMEAGAFVGGPEVAAFEQEYAAFSGVTHCIGVANGTDALEMALRAAGVGASDEVILPANTFVATAEAVARIGGRVVMVDIDPLTYLIDVPAALAAITSATRAIVPVHLYGQMAPVDELRAGLAGREIAIVEDAAQSQGATRHGHAAGSAGLGGPRAIASTSFYPGKNLGAYGDAGAVVTADAEFARTVRMLGAHGGLVKYVHEIVGLNSRLDALQAVVLRAKLARLARWNAARRTAAHRYDQLLDGVDIIRPATLAGNEHVWHLYVVRVNSLDDTATRRNEIVAHLGRVGIGAGIHYPIPLHLTPAFASAGPEPGALPHAEAASREILSLPLYPQITPAQQRSVVAELRKAL